MFGLAGADVLAHLVRNAESTSWSLMSDLLRGGLGRDHSVSKAAKRLGGVTVPELADRLHRAADERLRSGGSSKRFGVSDIIVHSADAFRPLGEDVDVTPDVAATVLDAYWDKARMVVHAALTGGAAWSPLTLTGPGGMDRRYERGPLICSSWLPIDDSGRARERPRCLWIEFAVRLSADNYLEVPVHDRGTQERLQCCVRVGPMPNRLEFDRDV